MKLIFPKNSGNYAFGRFVGLRAENQVALHIWRVTLLGMTASFKMGQKLQDLSQFSC